MKRSKHIFITIGLVLGLLLCIVASFVFGARSIPFSEVWEALFGSGEASFYAIVVQERIPRTIFSLLAGAALGVSGALMQSITRNPIADPSILGVNTGASLFVVIGIAFFQITTASQYIVFALVGAGLTAMLVFGIASMGKGGASPLKLALAGAASSAALSSLLSAIMLPRNEVMNAFRFWQVGSVSGATWEGIYTILPIIVIGILLAFLVAPALNALSLGEELATGLGVRTKRVRLLGAIAGIMLCGATTALAGPIGFVGLMIPHCIRLLGGVNVRLMMPLSALGGAILLTGSDVIGRLLGSPSELEVGIVTAFLGAPILIIIAMKSKVKAL